MKKLLLRVGVWLIKLSKHNSIPSIGEILLICVDVRNNKIDSDKAAYKIVDNYIVIKK